MTIEFLVVHFIVSSCTLNTISRSSEATLHDFVGDVLAVELVKLGIVQQLCRIQQPDLQQQALDLLTLLLGKGLSL